MAYHYAFMMKVATVREPETFSRNLQMADIFTKALGADKLWQFMTDLGLTILDLPSLRGSTEDTMQ